MIVKVIKIVKIWEKKNMSSMCKYDRQFHTVCTGRTLALIKGIQGYYGLSKQEAFEKMIEELAKLYNVKTNVN